MTHKRNPVGGNPPGRNGRWHGPLISTVSIQDNPSTPPIEYRTSPADLTAGQLASEILWIGDAVEWRGEIGRWARIRADALRRELVSREMGAGCE